MATFEAHGKPGLADRAALSLSTVAADAVARYRRWKLARDTREALSRLSDRDLADIGVVRSQIAEIAERVSRGA